MNTELIHSIILGLVQGLTEFLPISSSAHLIALPWFMGWKEHSMAIDVSLHLATFFAVMFYFRNDWIKILREGALSIKEKTLAGPLERKLFWYIIVATVPAVLVALMAGEKIEEYFRNPVSVAVMLGFFGLVLYLADLIGRKNKPLGALTAQKSFLIGLCQALAIIPGVSRSGVTISGGLFLGLNRESAAKFSFLLSAPIIFGAGIYKMDEIIAFGSSSSWVSFAGGFAAAFLSSIIAIHFLLKFIKSHPFTVFAVYRLAAAAALLAIFMFGGN
ncbi:MAG: undecaprenyl-diphosphatase UppP [Candidatus Omnitrophota bacterium]